MSNRLSASDVQSRPNKLRDKLIEFEAKIAGAATFSVAAESSNAIVVTVQLKQNASAVGAIPTAAKVSIAAATPVDVWISDTAGGVPSGTAPNGTVTVTVGTLLVTTTAKVLHRVVSTAAGALAISIGESTAKSFYLNVAHGGVVSSQIVTFA